MLDNGAEPSRDAMIPAANMQATPVYTMAASCLVIGLLIGYVSRGIQWSSPAPFPTHVTSVAARSASDYAPITLSEMKHMADAQAAPLVKKLKTDPINSALLAQVAALYHSAHQFEQAAVYYRRAVQIEPSNVALRTKLASSLYRNGEVDEAITQLDQALALDSNDANALFNLGIIRLQGKHDARGAIAAWQKLLRTNPQLSAGQRTEVQNLLIQAVAMASDQQGIRKEHAYAHP